MRRRSLLSIEPFNGHEYVDLGLPSGILWAKCNIGAASETEVGNYYMYGKGATQYSTTEAENPYTGTEKSLDLSLDTARLVMGGRWRTPTTSQFLEISKYCTDEWYDDYEGTGVSGIKHTSNVNGNSIFFPTSGYMNNGSCSLQDYIMFLTIGNYTYYTDDTDFLHYRESYSSSLDQYFHNSVGDKRKYGYVVRGIII